MKNEVLKTLLIDDDSEFCLDFKSLLPKDMTCADVADVRQAREYLGDNEVDIVFLDIDLGTGGNGLKFLQELKQEHPYLPVIMVTADEKIDSVVAAMRLGASGYVGKCPDLTDLKLTVGRAIEECRRRRRFDLMADELDRRVGVLVGESAAMLKVKAEIKHLAAVSSTVLITGQSGTGKELAAREIHRLSDRCGQPFLAVNCAALSRELIESELFGHEKGAFTGAHARHIGKFEQAGQGTLFLDEITEMPYDVQAKLLRVLERNEFERVGGNRLIQFAGRILASSNRNIEQAVKDGVLRQDLCFRLDVTRLHLPPLAEKKDDIPLLVDHFIRHKSAEMKKIITGISPQTLRLLGSYDWPGNVRELANGIESAIVHAEKEVLDVDDFDRLKLTFTFSGSYEESKSRCLVDFQRRYISGLLRKNGGNLTKTAEEIGLSRQGLAKIMKSCGLSDD